MTERVECCEKCRFWRRDMFGASGACRRRAPRFVEIGESRDSSFPTVGIGAWCGEFEPIGSVTSENEQANPMDQPATLGQLYYALNLISELSCKVLHFDSREEVWQYRDDLICRVLEVGLDPELIDGTRSRTDS